MSDVVKKLDENIPKEVVCTREQAGRTLSYLETWYVIDRLNQVLGQGNWSYNTVNTSKVFEGEVEQYSGKTFTTSYTAAVQLTASINGKTTTFTDVGYGDGFDKKNPGKAHELAIKEAVSDAVKRCAKNLGRSVGLALYDKTQEFVGVVNKEVKLSKDTSQPTENTKTIDNSSNTKSLIEQAFKVLEAQKKITKEVFKTTYLNNKGLSKIDLSDLPKIYEKMKQDFPALKGV